VFLGTIVGVLPGIGPSASIALLMPVTFGMNPTSALIMMAGIYYGTKYGGSTTSILIRTPGEAASVMTSIDGYEMAKNGRAGAALAVSAIGSFIAGTIGVVALTLFALPLASMALKFGPAEYFTLMLFAMTAVSIAHRRRRPRACSRCSSAS
jgi:putative tricarboxylic transport membrane protein